MRHLTAFSRFFCLLLVAVGLGPVFGGSAIALAQHGGRDADHAQAAAQPVGDPYPLAIDIVTGKPLPPVKEQVITQIDGREVRFASQESLDAFKKEPERYTKALDEAIVKQQLPYYPLETCVVSGGKLGGMGEPINFVYKNRLVRFCCAMCQDPFLKDPGTYLSKIDAAVIEAQKAAYPLTTCVVSDEAMGGDMGEPVDRVYATRLVRMCCTGCDKGFRKDPAKHLKKLDDAKTQTAAPAKAPQDPHAGHQH
ncbi:MAG: hypothetical protein WD042_16325 [Phycisphaeraceae bacterium]